MKEITRGTTPTMYHILPEEISTDDIQDVTMTISQDGLPVVCKSLSDGSVYFDTAQKPVFVDPDDNEEDEENEPEYKDISLVCMDLTQEETLKLRSWTEAKLGVRLLMKDGAALALRHQKHITIHDVNKGGVIGQ